MKVLSKDPLTIELYGTLAIRLLCFLLPGIGFLGFDYLLPNVSRKIKARGKEQLPGRLSRDRMLKVAGVAIGNVLLAILVQGILEVLFTRILRTKSLIKVTSAVPLPWSIAMDLLKGLLVRGIVHYSIHRFLLHTYDSILKTWHLNWQHSLDFPFSLVAAYDHPVNHLVSAWIPTILPAYLFRWHVLTWHLFLVLTSLEELFVFSGYSVLPSQIMLAGMARRTEAHFDSVKENGRVGNFGRLGLIDFLVGSTCQDEDDVLDDLQDEAEKHRVGDKIHDAVDSAASGIEKKGRSRKRK